MVSTSVQFQIRMSLGCQSVVCQSEDSGTVRIPVMLLPSQRPICIFRRMSGKEEAMNKKAHLASSVRTIIKASSEGAIVLKAQELFVQKTPLVSPLHPFTECL